MAAERLRIQFAAAFLAAALLGMTACGGKNGDGPVDPPVVPPQVPTTMEVEPSSTTGVVGTSVIAAPAVVVRDAQRKTIAGVYVRFVAANAGRVVNDSARTDALGIATSGGWTLGNIPGSQSVVATSAGLPAVTFTALAIAGPPQKLTAQSGNNSSGVSGLPLESFGALPSVLVTDAFNNPLGGIAVTFTPGANSGSITGSSAITNTQGIAAPTSWILGNVAAQTLVATSSAIPGTQVVFSASALVSAFDIVVRYIDGAPSARQQLAVSRAIARWRSVIVGNVGISRVKLDAQNCGRNWTPAVDEMVSNVLILARIGPIDGVGGIGGDSGPCVLHSSSGLTSFGTILFDSADLANLESSGLIDDVVAHEIGHVLGIGTLWTTQNLLTDAGTADPIFKGASAAQQFALLLSGYTGRPVPVENVGGPGSVGVHWRESVLRNELMTSGINSGTNPLSRVTVGSLNDLGYEVSFAGADAFSATSASMSSALMSSTSPFGVLWQNDVHVVPLFTTNREGRLIPLPSFKR